MTSKLLWIDLEMTGLDIEKEVIIEVAAIITDMNFNELGEYHAVVKQDQKYIDAMDAWNKEFHGKSGLIDKIPEGKDCHIVEQELCKFVQNHFQGEPAVLAGNSIAQDRAFIKKYMPKLNDILHYRMLDVTSWKIIFHSKFNYVVEKKNTHQALEDIKESIAELKDYVQHIQTSQA